MATSAKALFRHLVIGGLWRPVKARAEQELILELAQGRYSSFPFVSPDTFRAMCDVVIEDGRVKRRSRLASRSVIFFSLAEIEGTEIGFDDTPSLRLLEEELHAFADPPVVIMSDGDLLPSMTLISEIANRSTKVFSVNVVEETEKIVAIPLGLENFYRNRNGRLKDYLLQLDSLSPGSRTREVFAAFEPENNRSIREPLVGLVSRSSHGWNPRRIGPELYRRTVRDSLFVISPPGRGLDCHRTWEAIYLGAVPVVLDGALAPSLIEALPIHSVSNYDDFLNLSPPQMVKLFHEVREISSSKAYMPHWVNEVMHSAHGRG